MTSGVTVFLMLLFILHVRELSVEYNGNNFLSMPQKDRNQHSLKILMFISGKKPLQEYKQDSFSTMYVCILELHLVMSFNSLHTLS